GAFSIDGLPMTEHSLIAVAPGRLRQYINFDTTKRPDAELELRLSRGKSFSGKITDEDGTPIPDALISRSTSGTLLTLNGFDQACENDGTFKYDGVGLLLTSFDAYVKASGYVTQDVFIDLTKQTLPPIRLKKAAVKNVAADDAAGLEANGKPNRQNARLTTMPRKTFRGIVRDNAGKPVSGAEVRWGSIFKQSIADRAVTDSDGKFVMEQVPAGEDAVLVIADGFAPKYKAVPATTKKPSPEVEVVLDRGKQVRGVVINADGQPMADVDIFPLGYFGGMGRIWIGERVAKTNEKGEFKIDAIGEGLRFDVLKKAYTEKRNLEFVYGDLRNEIVLEPAGAIVGTVVDENDKPVRNFNVRLEIPREHDQDEKCGNYYAGFGWYGVSFTRDDGTFVLSGMNADHWMRLIVRAPGVGFAIVDRSPSEPLDQLSPFDQNVIRLQQFKPLSVHVIHADSKKPLPDATVIFLEDEPDFPYGFNWAYDGRKKKRFATDESGTAVFSEPACNDGTIAVSAAGYARKHTSWSDDTNTVTIELVPESTLSGTVHFRERPVEVGFVGLTNDIDQVSSIINSKGEFSFDQIAPGDYELVTADLNGEETYKQQVTVKEGEAKDIQIQIPE
ncbi:carboxypeptidase regulatory-like domain-containing protein, partial [Mariniblastus sp.]|nr:carboxypeptidase regulatory-like domain-containing protein [Mariniblastus sp.]